MSPIISTHRWLVTAVVSCITTAAITAGCTFEPGEPWGYLDTTVVAESLDDTDDIEWSDQQVEFDRLELRAPPDAAGGVEDFDPADPPAGFTLCHQDHCHHEDGSIYTYEEIEQGAGIDPDDPVDIARRDLDTGPLQLNPVAETDKQLSVNEQLRVNEIAVAIDELKLTGTAEWQDEFYDLEISLSMGTRPLTTGVSYEFGADHPAIQQARLELEWPDDLFDGLSELTEALHNADPDEPVEIHGTSYPDVREELVNRIAEQGRLHWIE